MTQLQDEAVGTSSGRAERFDQDWEHGGCVRRDGEAGHPAEEGDDVVMGARAGADTEDGGEGAGVRVRN